MKVNDLYNRQVDEQNFRRLCGGNDGEDGESCVEIAPLVGVPDAFALRDSKHPDAGMIRFHGEELRKAGIDTSIV